MAQVCRGWCGSLGIATLAMGWVALASGGCANAQVIPDATLGRENSTVTSTGSVDQITGGATRGANLFHSFEQFGVDAGRGAYFTNPAGIENILSRVTGSNPSNILGTLGVTGGDANLFLLNPNGISFGPSASLDVEGSFVATTANAIQFGEQGFFNSSVANFPLGLTVNPSAFLFNQIAAQPITNQSTAGLQVPTGESLLLVGGDVSLDEGRLLASGGRVELGGVAGSGTIGLSIARNTLGLRFPDDVARADVLLTNGAVVDVTGRGGGSIAITARDINILQGSQLLPEDNITLDATGTITDMEASMPEESNEGDGSPPTHPFFVTPDQVVGGSCLAQRNAERSSFTVTGTGGLPRSPYEANSGYYNVTGVQPIQRSGPVSTGAEEVKTTSWKRGDPIQEAQGLFVTADGRTLVGTTPQLATIAKAQDLVCSG